MAQRADPRTHERTRGRACGAGIGIEVAVASVRPRREHKAARDVRAGARPGVLEAEVGARVGAVLLIDTCHALPGAGGISSDLHKLARRRGGRHRGEGAVPAPANDTRLESRSGARVEIDIGNIQLY